MTIEIKKIKIYKAIILGLFVLILIASHVSAQEKFRKSPPLPYPLPDFNMPDIKTSALSNGLEISVVPRNHPFIDIHLIVMTGESLSPDHLPGLASFTANMLSKGSVGISASQVEEQIEYLGGDFSIRTYPDYSLFSLSVLKSYLNDAVELLGNMLIQPEFPKNEVNNIKMDMLYKIAKNIDPEQVGRKLLFQIMFDNHPYRKYMFNSDAIRRITRKHLISFFNKHYRPNNSKLLIIGDTDLPTAASIAGQHLGEWKKRDLLTYYMDPPLTKTRPKVYFTDISNLEEATIFVGNILPKGNKQDFFSYVVFNQLLGGSHISRLFMNLRETKGYAYWAFSRIEFFDNCGIFYVRAKVKPEHLYPSVTEILREIRSLSENKIPNHEIEQAKSYLIGHFPIKISEHKDFSIKIAEIIALNMKEIYWENYYENIMYINSNSVYKTLQNVNFLNPVIVIVGDKDIVFDYIKKFEEVEVYDRERIFQYKLEKGTKK